jgi:hypothetical protein
VGTTSRDVAGNVAFLLQQAQTLRVYVGRRCPRRRSLSALAENVRIRRG